MMSKQQSKAKDKYKILNWSSYNESLKQRGNITVWCIEDAIQSWNYNSKREQGGKIIYSDAAINDVFDYKKGLSFKTSTNRGVYEKPCIITEIFIDYLLAKFCNHTL